MVIIKWGAMSFVFLSPLDKLSPIDVSPPLYPPFHLIPLSHNFKLSPLSIYPSHCIPHPHPHWDTHTCHNIPPFTDNPVIIISPYTYIPLDRHTSSTVTSLLILVISSMTETSLQLVTTNDFDASRADSEKDKDTGNEIRHLEYNGEHLTTVCPDLHRRCL